jgi:hypothetical protein
LVDGGDASEPVRSLKVQGDHLYWSTLSGAIHRVPLAGGAAERLFTPDAQTPGAYVMGLDDQSIYWGQTDLFAMALSGGAPQHLAVSGDSVTAIFADPTSTELYLSQEHGLASVPKTGGSPRSLLVFSPGASLVGLAAGFAYVFETETQTVGPDAGWDWQDWYTVALRRFSLTGGPAESLAWMRGVGASNFTADAMNVYWTQSWGSAIVIRSMPVQGGSAVTLSEWGYTQWMATNDQYLYLSSWEWECKQQLYRIPKTGGQAELVIAGIAINQPVIAAVGGGKLLWATGPSGSSIRSLNL